MTNWRDVFASTGGRFGDHLCQMFPWQSIQGVEIGTGVASHTVRMLRNHPGLHLSTVDAFGMFNPSYRKEISKRARMMANHKRALRVMSRARQALMPFGNRVVLIQALSPDVAVRFLHGSLDFAYIDGNHIGPAVEADIQAWLPRIRTGGYIAGHDYTRRFWPGLCDAVDRLAARLKTTVLVKRGANPGGPEWVIGPIKVQHADQ